MFSDQIQELNMIILLGNHVVIFLELEFSFSKFKSWTSTQDLNL